MIDYNRFKEEILLIGNEYYSVLVDRQTGRVVEAFVRGKWVNAELYSVWQECYEAQKQRHA